jgi:hypothetical protein
MSTKVRVLIGVLLVLAIVPLIAVLLNLLGIDLGSGQQ